MVALPPGSVNTETSSGRDRLDSKNCHFGRAVHSDWHINRSYATTYERGRVVAAAGAGDERELPGGDGADSGQDDLAAVRMSAEEQRD